MFACVFETTRTLAVGVRPGAPGADVALVRRIKARDQDAFREVVEAYQHRVVRTVAGIVRDGAEAEEIAQEVFVKVYFAIGSFDCRSSLFTWIYRIAVNEAFAHLRRNRLRFRCETQWRAGGDGAEREPSADSTPAADRALAERDLLYKLLACLSEDERTLLLMKEVDGLSVARLSELTGLNANTVKVRLYRTRQKLVRLAARLSLRHRTVTAGAQPREGASNRASPP
jgi:RNA polymerase sigma-70 factor (ECF subfamily)